MKKVRIILASIIILATAGGAVAFKVANNAKRQTLLCYTVPVGTSCPETCPLATRISVPGTRLLCTAPYLTPCSLSGRPCRLTSATFEF